MRKAFLILIYCILFKTICLRGQCFESDTLWKKLIFLAESSRISPSEQLRELLNFDTARMNCSIKSDSAQAFLLSRIGYCYYRLGDYLKAVEYCRRSINMITVYARMPSTRPRDIISGYYWLSVFYDSLNNVTGKRKRGSMIFKGCYSQKIV